MKDGSKHEADADPFNGTLHGFRFHVQVEPKPFQHVGASAMTRDRAVPVLSDGYACASDYECCGGANIKILPPVPASSTRIQKPPSYLAFTTKDLSNP